MFPVAPSGRPLRVVVVARDETVRTAIASALAATGTVLVASCRTPAEAAQAVGDGPVDLAFVDERAARALLRAGEPPFVAASTIVVAANHVPPHRLAQLLRRFDGFVASDSAAALAGLATRVAAAHYTPVERSTGCC